MRATDALASLAHCRAVLARVTAGLTVEELDHCHFPDSKSNGEILLHIAGFEFLIIASAQAAMGAARDGSLWPALKAGFAREAGFAPPRRHSLDEYLGLLDTVRARATEFLGCRDNPRKIGAAGFAIRQVAQELADADLGEDPNHYRRLAAGVTTSFGDDGVPDETGMVEIAAVLALHETYHRGQITLNKYVQARLLGSGSRP
jgi:hypothetical protein